MDKVYTIWFTNNGEYEDQLHDLVCICATKEAAYARLEEMTQAIDDLLEERRELVHHNKEYRSSSELNEYCKLCEEHVSRVNALLNKYNIAFHDIEDIDFKVKVMDLIH